MVLNQSILLSNIPTYTSAFRSSLMKMMSESLISLNSDNLASVLVYLFGAVITLVNTIIESLPERECTVPTYYH